MSESTNRGTSLLPESLQPKIEEKVGEPPIVTEQAMRLITEALVSEITKAITPIKNKAEAAYELAANALPKTGGLITGNVNVAGTIKATGNIGGNEPAASTAPAMAMNVTEMTKEEILNEISRLKSEIAYLETAMKTK